MVAPAGPFYKDLILKAYIADWLLDYVTIDHESFLLLYKKMSDTLLFLHIFLFIKSVLPLLF